MERDRNSGQLWVDCAQFKFSRVILVGTMNAMVFYDFAMKHYVCYEFYAVYDQNCGFADARSAEFNLVLYSTK